MTNGFEARQHAGASDLNIVTVMLKKNPSISDLEEKKQGNMSTRSWFGIL